MQDEWFCKKYGRINYFSILQVIMTVVFNKKSSGKQRIEEGLKQADEGHVKPWNEVKARLLKRIKSKGR